MTLICKPIHQELTRDTFFNFCDIFTAQINQLYKLNLYVKYTNTKLLKKHQIKPTGLKRMRRGGCATLDVNSISNPLSSPTSNSPTVDRRTDTEKTSTRMDANQTEMGGKNCIQREHCQGQKEPIHWPGKAKSW